MSKILTKYIVDELKKIQSEAYRTAQELKGKLERTQYEQIHYVNCVLSLYSGCAYPLFKKVLSRMI